MSQPIKRIEFFVSLASCYDVISFDDLYYQKSDLYILRQEEGQLDFIEKIERLKKLIVKEVHARLIIYENGKSVDVIVDPVFKGGNIYSIRLKVIRNYFEKQGFKEIKMNFCDS